MSKSLMFKVPFSAFMDTKKEDESSSFFLVPLPYGGARGGFPSSWEGSGVGSLLANAAGDSQAGGDGGQDGCYCLNDEFPSFFLHSCVF